MHSCFHWRFDPRLAAPGLLALIVASLYAPGVRAQAQPDAAQAAPASAPASAPGSAPPAATPPAPADVPAPPLRASGALQETVPATLRPQLPTLIEGDRIQGSTDQTTTIEGDAMLRRGDTVIRADRIDYFQPDDLARATGRVRINRAGDVYEGPLLEMKVEAFEGFFTQPSYRFLRSQAYGQADRIVFLNEQQSVVTRASYTTCERQPGPGWLPEWILTADEVRFDNAEEVGYAKGAVLRFYGVPLLPVPAMSFPLSDKRKTGFLPPTVAMDSVSGLTIAQPYYLNLAPNRDATLTPTYMGKRGVDMAGEFRYLEPGYRGLARVHYMSDDALRGIDRWSLAMRHTDRVLTSVVPGGLGLSVEINRVGDDNYWRDFSRNVTPSLTQRLLANDANLSWSQGPLSLRARALKWQTLQDPTAPIVPPYDRMPQMVARFARADLPGGLVTTIEADYTRFESTTALTNQPNAHRNFLQATLSRPWQAPGWFFTPKMQLHATQYQFDTALTPGGLSSAHVAVPTFSLDSGLVFERTARWFGRDLVQTFEPRAFYVYTPWRNQNYLPNYDSALSDFNFATIFTDNSFVGHDRIADNNLLTLGATSRFQDPATGAQLARFGVAQRLRFKDQLVTLPGGTPVVDRLSDILVGASLGDARPWSADTIVQYNPKTRRSERMTLGGRYNPSDYRLISAAYRLQRGQSEQLDVGWQWPINDLWGDRGQNLGPGRGQGGGRWYSVGRVNVSLKDRRPVDTIIGFEYDGCCWIGRVVLERLQAGTTTANTRLLFQLEFVGFARLGTNALAPLRDNIPRYQFLREQVAPPSRFTEYD